MCSGQKEDWYSGVTKHPEWLLKTGTSWCPSLAHRQTWLLVLCDVRDVAVPLW